MTDRHKDETALSHAVQALANSARAIAHGDSQPTGLEMLSIAIAGSGLDEPLGPSIRAGLAEIAQVLRENLGEIAHGIHRVATEISHLDWPPAGDDNDGDQP